MAQNSFEIQLRLRKRTAKLSLLLHHHLIPKLIYKQSNDKRLHKKAASNFYQIKKKSKKCITGKKNQIMTKKGPTDKNL